MQTNAILGCWIEWKRFCALGLCSEQVQEQLREFACSRFRKFVRQYFDRTGCTDARPLDHDERDAWHLFEAHLVVKATKRGKCYKDWLFARAQCSNDPALDVIQGGATLIMRDVVREFLKQHVQPWNVISMDRPLVSGGDDSLTLHDLLPCVVDPSSEAAMREYEQLATDRGNRVFCDMTRRERVAVLAKATGVSLSHKAVLRAAGSRKSVLNTVYHALMENLASAIKLDFPDDDSASVLALTLMVVDEVKGRVLEWGRDLKTCAAIWRLADETACVESGSCS